MQSCTDVSEYTPTSIKRTDKILNSRHTPASDHSSKESSICWYTSFSFLLTLESTLVTARTIPLTLTKPCIFSIKYTGTLFFLTNPISSETEFSRDGKQLGTRRYCNVPCVELLAFCSTVLQLVLGSFSLHLKKELEIISFVSLTRFTRNRHLVHRTLKFYW